MSELHTQIADRVNTFVNDVTRLARETAMAALSSAFGAPAAPAAAPVKRGVGRPPKAAAPTVAHVAAPAPAPSPAPAAPKATRGKGRSKGAKRSATEIARTSAALGEYIAAHPGERIEHIGKALNVSTKELALPVQKLMADKSIYSLGQRRATKYFPKAAAARAKKK